MLRAAIEVAPGSIITIDELGSILSFNRAAEIAFGYTAGEVVGHNVAMLDVCACHANAGRQQFD